MSSPIAIPSRSSTPSSAASSPGLYVPVHRRTGSSSSSSSRSASTTRSESEHPSSPETPHPLIYSRASLLNLANSPLSRLSSETRETLRISIPEIMTNRKQRKAIEYRNQTQNQAAVSPVKPVITRRIRPVGRVSDRGRRNAGKVVDELGWRGRPQVLVPLTI